MQGNPLIGVRSGLGRGISLARLKCSKCGNVFEISFVQGIAQGLVHVGPYKRIKCPACGKSGFFNVYSSVKEPLTWPKGETPQQPVTKMTDEELEQKRIEESKYESS